MVLVFAFGSDNEREKFDYIFHKYRKLMLHKAYGILNDYALAEDAASEAFIRIYKNIHKIGDPDGKKAIAFVVTIVKNVSLTMLKKEKTHAYEELDHERDYEDPFNLEEHVVSRVSSEEMHRLLDELGEEMKAVFLLKHAYDLSHKEIGKMLGITENNVTVRLFRARKKLAGLVEKWGYSNA